MRVITTKRVQQFIRQYPDAKGALTEWTKMVKDAAWSSIRDARNVFPHADAAIVSSRRTATVFNVKGNTYRLVVAIHYHTGLVFVLRFLTHVEYDKKNQKWMESL